MAPAQNPAMIWLEGALVALMFVGLIAIFFERIKRNQGPWIVTVQILTVVFVFPTIALLALEGKVKEDAAATLLGTLVGYVLSQMGKEEGASGKAGTTVATPAKPAVPPTTTE